VSDLYFAIGIAIGIAIEKISGAQYFDSDSDSDSDSDLLSPEKRQVS